MVPVLRKSAVWLIIGSGVTILTALLVTSSVAAQVIPELDPAGCSDGSFVTEPEDNPDIVSDCEALIAIRNHWTNNPANNDLPSSSSLLTWGHGEITTWEGVEIIDLTGWEVIPTFKQSANTGSINAVSLYSEGIAGSIPEEFAQLKNLVFLDLSENRFTGVIPGALGQLSNLWSFNLHYNNLAGSIPAALGKLAPSQGGSLSDISLIGSGISGPIPDELVDIVLRKNVLWEPKWQPYDKSAFEIPYSECNDSFKGRFCDEDGSVHETNIETIAEMGITLGCSSDRFCPHEHITRAQMATFLYRAIEHKFGTPEPDEGTWWLADVPDDAWYRPYVEWAVSTRAMDSYDVIFNPSGRVTRIEMSKILAFAFPGLFSVNHEEIGGLFEDVELNDYTYEHISSVHSLYNLGVTSGCSTSPLLYCPDKPVNRGQMASFIIRALNPPKDPRYDDELGLIAYSSLIRSKSIGNVIWEVWSCDANGQSNLNLNSIAARFNENVTPYYLWLSEEQYRPEFIAGNIIQAPDFRSCQARANDISNDYLRDKNEHRFLVVIVADTSFGGGIGGGRALSLDSDLLKRDNNGEYIGLPILVHEIGHVLDWPHSYGGLVLVSDVTDTDDPSVFEYDNFMDMMSGCKSFNCGTLAINRYAAGWIDPNDVVIHSMSSSRTMAYELSPIGVDGKQILVIPTDVGQGVFYTLGVRVAKGYDGDIPQQGVEVYFIDQRPEVCEISAEFLCWGLGRITRPHPPAAADALLDRGFDIPEFTKHVYQPGDVFFVDEVRVEITERRGDRFLVKVG